IKTTSPDDVSGLACALRQTSKAKRGLEKEKYFYCSLVVQQAQQVYKIVVGR
ncbi:MAG: hypothetical protein JWP69_60, partial [Flaviaesturariibacter sp.]|nr:hypothetical protein [Flaviaesturariibacter sp.]